MACSRSRAGAGKSDGSPGRAFRQALRHFDNMIGNCYDYAMAAKERGRPVVGIMCEYTPRELIMAAGGVAVCLCGGSADTIPAAERHLPSNLCPLIKSTYGYLVEKSNPFLEMSDLIVAETTCDGKKKMFELMAESVPTYQLELPQKPDDRDAKAHWLRELRKLKAELERRFRVTITERKLRRAIRTMNRERSLRRKLAEFMRAESPALTGLELLKFKSSISGIPADLDMYQQAVDSIPGRRKRRAGSPGVRVLVTGVPTVAGAERVIEILEDSGGQNVCMENCSGLKPLLDDVETDSGDPMRALADKYFALHCSVMTPNQRRMEAMKRLASEYGVQCVIEVIWQACLTYDVESYLVRRLAEQELGIPYLRVETDYSPSDTARITTRVEALYETVRARGRR